MIRNTALNLTYVPRISQVLTEECAHVADRVSAKGANKIDIIWNMIWLSNEQRCKALILDLELPIKYSTKK